MSIAFINAVTTKSPNNQTNTSLVVTLASTTVGHFQVVQIAGDAAGTNINPTMTTPSGWTKMGEQASSAAGSTNSWGAIYYRFVQAGDAGTVTFSWTNAGQMIASAQAYSGVDITTPIPDFIMGSKVGSNTSYSVTLTLSVAGWLLYGFMNRTGTAWSATTDTVRANDLNASATTFLAEDTNAQVAAASYTKTATGSNTANGVVWAMSLKPSSGSNIAPTSDAGADKPAAVVGTPITLTGTDSDSDGTVSVREWTCTSRPAGAAAPTLTNAATASVTFTPAALGIYVLSYRVQDNSGAWSNPSTANVYVPGSTVSVIAITSNPGGWTNVGGAADIMTALSDTNDATYAQSATGTTNPSKIRLRLGPLLPLAVFTLSLKNVLSVTGSGTCYVRLFEGGTQRKQWTITPSTTAVASSLTLTSGEVATITDWLNLDVEIEWGV